MRRGFTFIELIIYLGIFLVISLIFSSVILTFTRLQSQHLSESELNNQLNFTLQTIQKIIASSNTAGIFVNDGLLPLDQDRGVSNNTLVLRRIGGATKDPTLIYTKNYNFGSVTIPALVIKEGTSSERPLTTNKASVAQLIFIKSGNYPGHDLIKIVLRLDSYPTTQNISTRTIQTTIGRASAATFDDTIQPSGNGLDIGRTSAKWQNGFFAGLLKSDGGVQVNTPATGKPSCSDSSSRGIVWVTPDTVGDAKDKMEVCLYNNTTIPKWDWRLLY